ncbi:phage portal protein [Limosilactobacillus fermentum]|uniref:phage portal protein n=1 Tax=Limosilactobacillus fermentum TaxID=1613 RepID=UPI002F26D56A
MPIFNSGGKSQTGLTIADDDSIIDFLNPGNAKYVDARTALHNSDIYSVIFQLSSDLANGQLVADSSRTQNMLDNPTVTANAHAFWQSMFAQLLLSGEAFAYRWRNQNGIDSSWEYLRPSQVTPFLLEDGSGLIYNATFDEPEIGVIEAIPQSDMIHLRLMSRNGGKTGISPLTALASELSIHDASNKLTLAALARSIMAPGILSITKGGLLDGKQKAARSAQFMKQMNDSNSGPIVLDDLESYTPLEVQGNVAQLLSQATWTGAQIAKVYGVSDSIINGQGDQQSSLDMIGNDYVKALTRYSNAITSELTNKLAGNITLDLRPVVDPAGDGYASTISSLAKSKAIDGAQAVWLLTKSGYFPEDMPESTPANDPPELDQKGGDQ